MKKSLSVISSLLFAALCLGFAFNAYAQDVTALNDANTVISISEQNYVYDGTLKRRLFLFIITEFCLAKMLIIR